MATYNINNSKLRLYYPFDKDLLNYASGVGVNDNTGNMTINTVPNSFTQYSLGSADFISTSVNTNYPFRPSAVNIDASGVTIALYMNLNGSSSSASNYRRIYDSYTTAPGTDTFFLYFSPSNNLYLGINGGTGGGGNLGYTITDFSGWHHYCLTINSSGTVMLYVDGSGITTNVVSYPRIQNYTNTYIARSSYPSDNSPYGTLNAKISQFVLLNRVITPTELSFLVNNPDKVKFSSAGTGMIYPCFRQGSKILSVNPASYQEEYVPVETLKPGDLIKTSESGYKELHSIGYRTISLPKSDSNPSNRLYKFSQDAVFEPLYITGEHCTLHRDLPKEKLDEVEKHMERIHVTENHYRVPAMLDDRAEEYDLEDEPTTIWHFALDHEDVTFNYGVYANGLLVESCAIESLKEKSGMQLLE